jgi:DNA-binding MarR family transcriptional regulator
MRALQGDTAAPVADAPAPASDPHFNQEDPAEWPRQELDLVRFLLQVRKAVGRHFGFDLCGNPALDMLLDLYSAIGTPRATSLSSLSHAANVPARTALSWIHRMVDRGLLKRMPDPQDRRRVHVELTDEALAAFEGLFKSISA